MTWRDSLPDARAGRMLALHRQSRLAARRNHRKAEHAQRVGKGRRRASTVHAVALHEVGHLLEGWSLGRRAAGIMAAMGPRPLARLTRNDVSTLLAHALYGVAADFKEYENAPRMCVEGALTPTHTRGA
jgi:hypothetical protein